MKLIRRNLTLLLVIIFASLLSFFVNFQNQNTPSTILSSNKNSQETNETIRQITVNINDQCKKLLENQAPCFEENIKKQLLLVYAPKQVLEAIYDFDTYYSCHAFTHFLGRALYKNLGNIADAYSQINFTCHGGSYHGVMEAYLDQNKINIGQINGFELRSVCNDSKRLTKLNPEQIFTECLHGFGHAFMFITDSDLPLSLSYCDKLDTTDERERCYGGAFMENSTSSTSKDHKTAWIKPGDKFFPCTVLKENYLNQCYFYQANYLIMSSNRNYPSVFNDCDKLSGTHRTHCILGIGASLASVSNEQGIQKAAEICSLGKIDTQSLCVGSAVSSLFARYGGETEKILSFCNLVAENLKGTCFIKIGEYSRSWGKNQQELERICESAKLYKDSCLGINQEAQI